MKKPVFSWPICGIQAMKFCRFSIKFSLPKTGIDDGKLMGFRPLDYHQKPWNFHGLNSMA